MREKINQVARGEMKYEQGNVLLSANEIHIEIKAGEQQEGTFVITNDKGSSMRGMVTSDCHFLTFQKEVFVGESNEITYLCQGENLVAGSTIKGCFHVISDCGTKRIPVTVVVGVPSYQVSTGKIRDLFHFTNLAQEKPQEAANLFRDPHFEETFLFRDNANIALYRGLVKGTGKGMALEEFLIAIHKKLPIQLSVNQSRFQYENCTGSFTDNFIITKNNWGFGEFHIESDSDFIVPEHRIIWTDDFTGDVYSMPFLVDTEKMTPGKNYARIVVSSVRQKIEIMIEAHKAGNSHEQVCINRRRQQMLYQLVQYYLDFCMDRLDRDGYLDKMEQTIRLMEQENMPLVTRLFKVHLAIMRHNEQQVKSGLAYLKEQKEILRQKDGILYDTYCYLCALWEQDEEKAEAYVEEIRSYYEKNPFNWKGLWLLLYTGQEFSSDSRKYEAIEKQLNRRCVSPVMYVEICSILNETPDYLMELSPGICRAIHWGSKHDFIEKETALRYSYLAGKLKEYSKVVVEDLCSFYRKYKEDEILASICKTLMKGQITTPEAFYWYSKGVEHNLKLTDLYEYYMYSIDEKQQITLQDSALLYFLYDNHLTVSKKAMLYAYVVRNRENLGETYEAYVPIMKEYTMSQLAAGRVSSNLAVLYEEFLHEETITEEIARELPKIMFCHEIICDNEDIVGVYITHGELQGEEFVPFVKGRALVSVFTQNHRIFLADKLDNRYAQSVDYTTNKLLHLDHLAEKCLEKNGNDYRLILYLYDKADRMNQMGKKVMDIRQRMLEIPNLSRHHYKKAFCALVRYYYDNFEGDLLDAALQNLDWNMVNPSERKQFIEYCAVRRFFEKAMEGIEKYGYEGIDGKRLLKISTQIFQKKLQVQDTNLVKLAYTIFQTGHFDENTMKYLCRYYIGTTNEMVQIWRYAQGFSLDTQNFAQRILECILFTEEMPPDGYEVFYEYYERGEDKRLLWAFMKFIAYKYLVHNWIIPNKIFSYFYREVQRQENEFALIACLKYLSHKDRLNEEEKQFADYHINRLYEKKIVFPFYQEFYGKLSLPIHILDQYYVEYTTNPEYEVKIHYLISSGYEKREFVTETMRDIFCGVRVKEFVLFQDEILQYYISEVRPEGEKIVKSVSVGFDETMDNERTSSRYHMLNLMMIAQEMNEENTLIDLMKEYVELKENVNTLFTPLD